MLRAVAEPKPHADAGQGIRNVGRLIGIAVQLALVALVIRAFHIEESFGFQAIVPLILAGFAVNALLPLRLRLPFFVLLGMTAPLLVFGWEHGAVLIVLALGLIALCHLPIPFWVRVASILFAAVGLALGRAELVPLPGAIATVVLPILAAMFMFRLAIYLYDLRHEKTPASWWQRIGYFFLLPNVCFPLFPVVDYQAFKRTYYDTDDIVIYQKGVLWMLRGITHILVYRIIYYHLLPAPPEVAGLGGVAVYMLATYGLYLRISGQFHLIVGILCLFGFNLPETHHLYYLAGSFNDYWRRINIYWKDFMMKLFYYPALMRLRRWGMTAALIGATIFVFFGTWILHSYQWFWLRGAFPFTGPDALFWGILGALVVANSLQEARGGARRRKAKTVALTWRDALVRSARVVGMFVFICILWSLWSSPSVGGWLDVVSRAGDSPASHWVLLAAVLAALTIGGASLIMANDRGWQLTLLGPQPSYARSFGYVGIVALALLGASRPEVQGRIAATGGWIASIETEGLNAADRAAADRGYYEGLLEAPRYTSALWLVREEAPKDWEVMQEIGLMLEKEGVLDHELAPSFEATVKRAPFRTNQWGMRDRDYALAKSAGTHRTALIGASYTIGSGVPDDGVWSAIVEDRLNAEHGGATHGSYEILNFAVGGYSILHNIVVTREKVLRFNPDVLLFTIHKNEANRLAIQLAKLLAREGTAGVPGLDDLLGVAGVEPGMTSEEINLRLEPHLDELLAWGFAEIAELARQNGIIPAAVYLPMTPETREDSRVMSERILSIAADAGFVTLSLANAYGNLGVEDLQLAPWDTHPNALGHRLIAESLYRELVRASEKLRLGIDGGPQQAYREHGSD